MSISDAERNDLVKRLKDFDGKLVKYWNLANGMLRTAREGKSYSKKQWTDLQALRVELLRLYGGLEEAIEEYGGPATVRLKAGVERNAYAVALGRPEPAQETFVALEGLDTVVNKAIGKIMSPPASGTKAEGALDVMQPPKAFIAHGGQSAALEKLCDYLEAVGVRPIVVERQPSGGMSVDAKIAKYEQQADCAIILATRGGIVDKKTRKEHPRLNVIDELARLRKTFDNKVILLVEKGVELPSNVAGIAYEHFTRQSMDTAFTAIARELRAFGLVKAIKG